MERKRPSKMGGTYELKLRKRRTSQDRTKKTELGALTSWRRQGEGQARIRTGSDRVRSTHNLETGKEGAIQDNERK